MDWDGLAAEISEATGEPFRVADVSAHAGGSIHRAQVIRGVDGRRYFVKTNAAADLPMFETEMTSLRTMRDADAIRVPEPVCCGENAGRSYIVLEYIALSRPRRGGEARLGEELAALHRFTGDAFGFHEDNFCGRTPQGNTPADPDWVAFYRDRRLEPQFRWAREKGLAVRGAERLMENLDRFFEDYRPAPSLLHGDLHGGNIGFDAEGKPVIFDPACYYGDREADIAFTEVFGGPGRSFYEAYHAAWPMDADYAVRKELYNLYHILNHYNLFGGGYGPQAEGMVANLLGRV